jgi:hypothetical protein
MANHCWNAVIIEGKPDVLAKIEVLFDNYKNYDYLVDWANTFFPNMENLPSQSDYLFYGTRWWDSTCDMTTDVTLHVTGDSAWSPPLKLLQLISEYYGVRCEITFSESGMGFAGKCIWENGNLEYSRDMSYSEHVYEQNGVQGLIDEYLYDEDCLEYYESPKDFESSMKVQITDEEMEYLKEHFASLQSLNKQEIIDELEEIKNHLENLEMHGLAKKVEKMFYALSIEWRKELKEKEDE